MIVHQYFVNYRVRPTTRKPRRLWKKASKFFTTEKEALQWMKKNGLKINRWNNIEKCEVYTDLLKDIFSIPQRARR